MDVLLQGLNDAQKYAVTSPASILQVLAPPGSGKTKTLTARVAYLLNHERLKPWNIIVCTFTIKAAREMRNRIRGLVGDGVEAKLILGTFHSVARRFLVRYGQEIGIEKNFGIADTTDSKAIVKRIIKRNDYTIEFGVARSRISGLKAKGTTAEQFAATAKHAEQHEFACVYTEYEETLKTANLLDYDDLLLRCVDLLHKHPACASSIEAVLIDEYQDTNNVQYDLMKLLAQRMKRITIVGDPDQSIYGFRSAEIKNLHRMREDYPDHTVINLEENYRSSGCILSSAQAIIEQDESRESKALQATHCVGEPPTLRHLATAAVEAQWIVEEIERARILTAGLLNYNDYAILLRSGSISMLIEKALAKAGIPYRMVGGLRFFDRAEIKIVLDYLRVINQPDHNDALVRVINTPSRKIGDTTIKGLLQEAEARKATLWSVILNCAKGGRRPQIKISNQAQKGIDTFVHLILTARRKLLPEEGEECYLLELIKHVLQKIDFQAHLKKEHKENWQERWANVEELVLQATQMAHTFKAGGDVDDNALPVVEGIEQRQDTAADVLSKFLTNVALSTEVERPEGEELNQVTISTIHAAKGLEWPIVFIPAVYEGSIPHSRAEDHDEERRLLYVGMTRAQALLYLSCPVKQSAEVESTLSRFVSPRDIQKNFSRRGPSIGCSVITDLALILRRPCPGIAEVEAARNSLERVADDLYPANREEYDGEDSSWGMSNFSSDGPQHSFKRRKLEPTKPATGITAAVTMHQSSSFAVATATLPSGNAGFTSASTHMKILREAKMVGTLISAPTSAVGKAAYKEAKRSENKETKPRGRPAKPRGQGQGAITSFFGRSMVVEEIKPCKPIVPVQRDSSSSFFEPRLNSPQRSSSSISSGPLSDISNIRPGAHTSGPYQPPTFSTHRPRNAPMLSKPTRPEVETEVVDGTKYGIFSSSPVKPDDDELPGRRNDMEDENLPEKPDSPTTSTSVVVDSSSTTFRPATTFHATSISQLGQQKKTLGMRRSVQGWSVKHQQMPRPK